MKVLILIVVDDGLVLQNPLFVWAEDSGLNPYCSGRWSRTVMKMATPSSTRLVVLILIVVDDGLVLLLK